LCQAKFRAHHEKRLEEISRRPPGTGTLDNMPPYTSHLMHLKTRRKKMAILASRDAQVERANRDLLRQMTRIFTTPSALLPIHDSADGGGRGEGLGRCLSINVLCRKRELERIAMANKTWVKHMENVSPSYNAAAWEREWLERKRIIERLRTVRYAREKATPEEFSRRGVTHLRKQARTAESDDTPDRFLSSHVQQTRGQAFEAGFSAVPRLVGSTRSKNRGQSGKSNNGGGRNVGARRNRQSTKRKCFSSSSRSNRGKRIVHGHGRDTRGGVLLRSGSERGARAGSKHEQQQVKRVASSGMVSTAASESSMVSSGDGGREEQTSCQCPPPLVDSDYGQDGDHLPICVSIHATTRGAEKKTSDGSQAQHGKTATAAAAQLEGVGGAEDGGGGGGGDDDGENGSQSEYSEFAGGEGDEEEQYSEFDEGQQEERREEKEEEGQDGQYSEFGDGSSTCEAVVQPDETNSRSSEIEDVRQEQRIDDGLEIDGEKQKSRGGSGGAAKTGLDGNDCGRGQNEERNPNNSSTETICSPKLQLESAAVELEDGLGQNDTSFAETASGATRIEPQKTESPEQQEQEQQQHELSVTKAQDGEVESKSSRSNRGGGSMRTGEGSELSEDNGYRSESFDGDGYSTDSGVSGPVPEALSTTQKAGTSPAGSAEPPKIATPEGGNSNDSCSSPPPLDTSSLLVEDQLQPGGSPMLPLEPPQPQEDPQPLPASSQPISVASSCRDVSPEPLEDSSGLDDPPPLPANNSLPSSPPSLPEDTGDDNGTADIDVVDQPVIPLCTSDSQSEPGAHDHAVAAIPDPDTGAGLVVVASGNDLPGTHSASESSSIANIEDSAPTNLAGESRMPASSEEYTSADASANDSLSGGASTAEGASSSGVNGDSIETPLCGTTVTPAATNEHCEERNELAGTGGWSMVPETLPPSRDMEQASRAESPENIKENASQGGAATNDDSATTGPLAQHGALQQPTTADGLHGQDSLQDVGEDSLESSVTLKLTHGSTENSDPTTTATVLAGEEEESRCAEDSINVEESDKTNELSVSEDGNGTMGGEPEAVQKPAAETKEPSGNGTLDMDPIDDGVDSPGEAPSGVDAAACDSGVSLVVVKEVQDTVNTTEEPVASFADSGENTTPTSVSADVGVHEASTGRESAAREPNDGLVSSGRINENDGPDHSVSVGHEEPSTVGGGTAAALLDDDQPLGPNKSDTGKPDEIPEAIGGGSDGQLPISADGAGGNSGYDEVFEEMSSSTEQAAEAVSSLDGGATTSTAETGIADASLFSRGKQDPTAASEGGDAGEPPLATADLVGESPRFDGHDSRGG
ncbi:unnamed protein product, partial [Ectocarpus fasciculatus]